ncbi:hypothetical protein [Sulfobacillus thermosulfidooxidans]|nr:hypothetical protein [Sulfobacillus thermosulfidooxidans]
MNSREKLGMDDDAKGLVKAWVTQFVFEIDGGGGPLSLLLVLQ